MDGRTRRWATNGGVDMRERRRRVQRGRGGGLRLDVKRRCSVVAYVVPATMQSEPFCRTSIDADAVPHSLRLASSGTHLWDWAERGHFDDIMIPCFNSALYRECSCCRGECDKKRGCWRTMPLTTAEVDGCLGEAFFFVSFLDLGLVRDLYF